MSQRTRRASEAVEIHYDFLDGCRPGSSKSKVEDGLLDVTQDPNDKRFGHGDFLYGKGKGFQDFMRDIANRAMTFSATTDLWREVELSLQMLEEEDIDWLPLQAHHLPAETGFLIFPYGIKVPTHVDDGMFEVQDGLRGSRLYDQGGGSEWWVDGLLWTVSDRVAVDGFVGPPRSGISLFPLTRWRGDPNHRPFRLEARISGESFKAPHLVASDITAWAFDEPGSYEWGDLSPESGGDSLAVIGKSREDQQAYITQLVEHRNWMRKLVWVTFRWFTEEVWLPEAPDNRQLRRKMQRARPVVHENTMEDGEIVIVDLRLERREAIAKGETGGEPPWWRSRWIVRGHWAKRRFAIRDEHGLPVGPTRGEGAVEGETFYYKKVKILPFVKGPDSAPLVLRDRVGVLSR